MNRTGVVAVLCGFLWISSACSTQEFGFGRDGQNNTEIIRQNYEVHPGGTLTVDAESGAIHISSSVNNEVDVLVRKRLRTSDADRVREEFNNVEVEIRQTDNGVRIAVERIDDNLPRWFWQDRTRVEIEVTVPVDFNLDLSTVSDDIQTGNIKGDVTAETLSGEISTGPTEGNVNIETVSGNIKTSRVEGSVHGETLDGNIVIGPVNGNATLSSTSGSIETDTVEGDLNAGSLSGHIRIGPVNGDATLSSTSGDIRTSHVQGKLKTSTLSGNITNR